MYLKSTQIFVYNVEGSRITWSPSMNPPWIPISEFPLFSPRILLKYVFFQISKLLSVNDSLTIQQLGDLKCNLNYKFPDFPASTFKSTSSFHLCLDHSHPLPQSLGHFPFVSWLPSASLNKSEGNDYQLHFYSNLLSYAKIR